MTDPVKKVKDAGPIHSFIFYLANIVYVGFTFSKPYTFRSTIHGEKSFLQLYSNLWSNQREE